MSTGCLRMRAFAPLFGFSSGRYNAAMSLQHTARTSKHAPRFPNRIREYRLKAGLSQRRLAELIGRDRAAVSSWERGLTPAERDAVRQVSEAARHLGGVAVPSTSTMRRRAVPRSVITSAHDRSAAPLPSKSTRTLVAWCWREKGDCGGTSVVRAPTSHLRCATSKVLVRSRSCAASLPCAPVQCVA